MRVVLLAA